MGRWSLGKTKRALGKFWRKGDLLHYSNKRDDALLHFTLVKFLARTLLEKIKLREISNLEMTNKFRKEKLFKYHITNTEDLVLSITQWGF